MREAADGLHGRLDELERELGTLLDALRQSGERLSEGLTALQKRVGQAQPVATPTIPRRARRRARGPPRPAATRPERA